MHLNGWQRIGMVVSVLWALGAAIYERNQQVNSAMELYQFQYRICLENHEKNCGETVSMQAAMDATANWIDIVFYALGPIIAGWFIAFITIRTFRWISDGFSKNT